MSEADLMRQIQIDMCHDSGVRLWRNNVGDGWVGSVARRTPFEITLSHYRPIHFGLGVGTSDLIGLRSIEITPDMVGKRVAVFTALEVKSRSSRPTPEQRAYVEVVKFLGGFAGVVRSVGDAEKVMK